MIELGGQPAAADELVKDATDATFVQDVAEGSKEVPIIVDFWSDSLFRSQSYHGNPLGKHLEITQKLPLKPGHFTRWLYLFDHAVDSHFVGENADLMKARAEMVAKSFSAAITDQKRRDMNLTLPKAKEIKF